MKAIVMEKPGGPDVLSCRDLDIPEIQSDHDVLIRIHAAGVNPVDTKLRTNGTYFPDALPTILGCDGAGEVVAKGSAVSRFKPGDRVYYCYGGIGREAGNYAEYNVVPEHVLASAPSKTNLQTAAAAPLVLITAWEALFDQGKLESGQSVLIHAGAGGVGHVAIQLAKHAGARVCTTVSSKEKADFVRSLGADHVILYTQENFVESVLDWTQGDGVYLAIDTVGGTTFQDTPAALAVYGNLVTLLQPPGNMDWKTARIRNQVVSFVLMLTPMYLGLHKALQHQADILEKCSKLIDAGELAIQVSNVMPLTDAAQAHRRIEEGHNVGKIVLSIA